MNNIENIDYPAPKREYKVLVKCLTFNHSKYIKDTFNGFAMQQTNFPFVCLVLDDASTDGEQDVIKNWMERECDMDRAEIIEIPTSVVIIVPHKNNSSCTFAFYLLKQNLYGTGKKDFYVNPWREKCEYEAICEGDDYWIDSFKLQKQVDYLDDNIECSMVVSNGYYVNENKNNKKKIIINPFGHCYDCNIFIKDLLSREKELIPTASMLYRTLYRNTPDFILKAPVGDKTLRLWYSLNGYIHYMNAPMILYRMNCIGSFGVRTKNKSLAKQIKDKMIEFYDNFDIYTGKNYSDLISIAKEQEYYDYYNRIDDYISVIKNSRFKYKSLIVKFKTILKVLLYNIFKIRK